MARLYPFRALRCDPTRVNMTDILTQPYDNIAPAMQDSYCKAGPYNLIRIILRKHKPATNNNDWCANNILDDEPQYATAALRHAAPVLAALALAVCLTNPAVAQGCSQCLDSTRATPPAVQAAYRHAIILLGGAGATLFIAGAILLRRTR